MKTPAIKKSWHCRSERCRLLAAIFDCWSNFACWLDVMRVLSEVCFLSAVGARQMPQSGVVCCVGSNLIKRRKYCFLSAGQGDALPFPLLPRPLSSFSFFHREQSTCAYFITGLCVCYTLCCFYKPGLLVVIIYDYQDYHLWYRKSQLHVCTHLFCSF